MSEIRPEVVERLLAVLDTMDVSRLGELDGATAAEVEAAWDLHLAGMVASRDQRDRQFQALQLVLSGREQWQSPPSWSEAFDELQPHVIELLRPLCWDMHDGARAEFDRRFGRPVVDEA